MSELNRILNKCVRAGASMAEVYSINQESLNITVRDGKVETIAKSTPGGLAIRFYSVDRVAFAHTTDMDDNAIDLMIAKLSSLSKKTSKQDYASLPKPREISGNLDLYSPGYSQRSVDDKIKYLVELEKIAQSYDPLIKQSNGMNYRETLRTVNLLNTNGIDSSTKTTSYQVSVNVVASKGDEMFPGEGSFTARHFEDLPATDIMVDKIAGRAVRLLGGTAVDPGEYEIIMAPSAAMSIFWGMLYALNGDNFNRGSSFLAGKENEKISDSKLTVIDNARMTRGIRSRPFDDEGIPSQTNILIEDGVLKSALYDFKTAAKYDKKPTGSASRRSYNDFPGIWPTNMYVKPGTDKIEDVISSCKKGIVVESTQGWGLHSVNGSYSAGINGTLIRNGKRIKPVANVTLASSGDELLNGIGAVCDDITFYHQFNSPSIMIKKMHVGA